MRIMFGRLVILVIAVWLVEGQPQTKSMNGYLDVHDAAINNVIGAMKQLWPAV